MYSEPALAHVLGPGDEIWTAVVPIVLYFIIRRRQKRKLLAELAAKAADQPPDVRDASQPESKDYEQA